MPNWSFSQLENCQDFKRERDEGFERGLLQVHERQRQIQLSLLPHPSILPNDELQLETELLVLFLDFYHPVRSVLQNHHDCLFWRDNKNVRQRRLYHDDSEQIFASRQGPRALVGVNFQARIQAGHPSILYFQCSD
jgi:hypothetical protein